MRSFLIAAASVLVITPTWAQFVDALKIAESADAIVYIEPGTLLKDGDLRRIWILYDQKVHPTTGGDSARIYQEFDCKERRTRVLSFISYSGHMAKGEVISKEKQQGDWEDVAPQTADESGLGWVCAR